MRLCRDSGQQASIKGQVGKIHTKLDEIYEWFLENLKKPGGESVTSIPTPENVEQSDEGVEDPDDSPPLFSLYRQKQPGNFSAGMTPVCLQATFNPALFGNEISDNLSSLAPIFCCRCDKSRREGARSQYEHTAELIFARKSMVSRKELS